MEFEVELKNVLICLFDRVEGIKFTSSLGRVLSSLLCGVAASLSSNSRTMADLKPADVELCKLHFEIYDSFAEGKIDAADLGPLMRSLDLRVTEAMVEKAGGSKDRGAKKMTVEEILPIYSQLKKEKDMGTLNDFIEGLKVYDKMDNGTLMAAELSHVLQSLGEILTTKEAEEIMADCSGAEDEEGFIKYEHFAKTLLGGPFPAKK